MNGHISYNKIIILIIKKTLTHNKFVFARHVFGHIIFTFHSILNYILLTIYNKLLLQLEFQNVVEWKLCRQHNSNMTLKPFQC